MAFGRNYTSDEIVYQGKVKEPYMTIGIDNRDEVIIRVVDKGVKIRDITMGDLAKLVEYLIKKEGK